MQEIRAIISGFGGQGILFAGKVITYCGMVDDRYLSWLPSYGPEMRGGTCNCSVTVSDRVIGSPLVVEPTVLIAMNQPSVDKFFSTVAPGGTVIIDSGLTNNIPQRDDLNVFAIPATELAEDAGLKGMGNVVMVGKLHKELEFCSLETMKKAIQKCCPASKQELYGLNIKALEIGRNA